MFKRLILAAAIVLIAVSAQAADIIKWNGLNVAGDTLYLPSQGTFAVGIGTDLATVYDVMILRGMFVVPTDNDDTNMLGVGLGVNLPVLIGKLGGDWIADNVNASIGVAGLINMDGTVHISPSLYATVIKW